MKPVRTIRWAATLRLAMLALALLFGPAAAARADVLDYGALPPGFPESPLTTGGVTATAGGGQTLALTGNYGLGVVGGFTPIGIPIINGSESVHFQFDAGPATEVAVGGRIGATDDVNPWINLEGFDSEGNSLGVVTFITFDTFGEGGLNVSAAFGNVPLSGFTISGNGSDTGIPVAFVSFSHLGPDPVALIEGLAEDVVSLVESGATLPADGRSLYAKLEAAAAALEAGNPAAAATKLQDFINQVRAFVKTGRLSAAQGQALTAAAADILDLL